jgi:molybdopterin synthase catalytic subunit
MMQIRVKLFGALREAAGTPDLALALPEGSRVGDVWGQLVADHPSIEPFKGKLAVSLNFEISNSEADLSDGDEVAFLPPVSGGAGSCSLTEEPIDVGAVVGRVTGPGMGGIVTFLGTVRDHARGKEIRHLEYESYAGMAEREMEKIVNQAAERWPGVRVAIAHRAGHLKIGDIAVAIVAAAAHRGDAFEACRFAIDTLKETVPIWKKEFATDGEYWVDDRP